MTTILLCGYRASFSDAEVAALLDRRLQELKNLATGPVLCVLAGHAADEVLRACPRLVDAGLSYDNSGPNVSLVSNILVGLEDLGPEGCLILPLEIPCPDRAFMIEMAAKVDAKIAAEDLHILQGSDSASTYGFPLGVTRLGNVKMQRIEDLKSLLDPRLKYQSLASDPCL